MLPGSQEHCREAIGEEELFGRPEVQRAMTLFSGYKRGVDYADLREQGNPLDDSLEQAPVEDDDMEEDDGEPVNPEDIPMFDDGQNETEQTRQLGIWSRKQGWHEDLSGDKIQVAYNAWSLRTPQAFVRGDMYPKRTSWIWRGKRWNLIEDRVNWRNLADPRSLIGDGKAAILVTIFHKNRKTASQMISEDSVPVCLG